MPEEEKEEKPNYYFKRKPKVTEPLVADRRKIGRNEKCPCNSGKKYKKCHGK